MLVLLFDVFSMVTKFPYCIEDIKAKSIFFENHRVFFEILSLEMFGKY